MKLKLNAGGLPQGKGKGSAAVVQWLRKNHQTCVTVVLYTVASTLAAKTEKTISVLRSKSAEELVLMKTIRSRTQRLGQTVGYDLMSAKVARNYLLSLVKMP